MAKVLITGGTGLIGKQLTKLVLSKGYEVAILSRNPKRENEFRWNVPESYIDDKALKNVTHIVHLAGAGIADKRWTSKRKQELINSRVKSTDLLLKKVQELKVPLKKIISASGIGFYGAITSDTVFTENESSHNDFISKVCVLWEKSVQQFEVTKVPVTIFRTGIVLAKNGGALPKINTPLFLSVLGKGNQYMPWIHINDLCHLYLQAIGNPNFNGVFNAVSPDFQTNASFTKILGKVVKKPVFPIKIPSFVLKIILGEMANILLSGSRISVKKTQNKYHFIYSNLGLALQNIYGK